MIWYYDLDVGLFNYYVSTLEVFNKEWNWVMIINIDDLTMGKKAVVA
jgi:hypothetical protein